MPNDLPVIITNTLDLDNRNILTYHDTAEMFQAILVSLTRLLMSLFFNTGPRKDGKHQNRWVPVKIGADTLASDDSLVVQFDHLLYRHVPESIPPDFSIFVINEIVSWNSTFRKRGRNLCRRIIRIWCRLIRYRTVHFSDCNYLERHLPRLSWFPKGSLFLCATGAECRL
jgi:hypothetical protein